MTKKHFQMIADAIANAGYTTSAVREAMARDFADKLARENPRFNRSRFLAACGVE